MYIVSCYIKFPNNYEIVGDCGTSNGFWNEEEFWDLDDAKEFYDLMVAHYPNLSWSLFERLRKIFRSNPAVDFDIESHRANP